MPLNRDDLHPYQHSAVDYIIDKGRCMLALDMGLGKTTSTLTAISDMVGAGVASKVLIIAPLRVCNSVWAQEARKWQHTKHLRVSVATGAARARTAALFKTADVYVINKENVPWIIAHYGKKWPFDMIVIDESSTFKNSQSKRFKALRKVLPFIERLVLLTGTPSPNGLQDLWAQMFLVDHGERLGRTLTGFRDRFFDKDYFGYTYKIRPGSAPKIEALVADKVIHMSANDYLDLPDRIDIDVSVDLGPKAAAEYKDFERTSFAELDDGQEVEALSAAVLANKLMQFSNGALYTDKSGAWSSVHSAKLDALSDLVDDNSGETMLVAYNFKSDLARLKARFPQAVLLDKSQDTIDRWNRGEIEMLLAHPASAGHGLNLQAGGALCVWFGLNWSLELTQQFNARLHRQGQGRPVRIVRLLGADTIDARVAAVLRDKDATQASLLAALKPRCSENNAC
jgi:SNF2 family DNA or RNA helicase